MLKTLLKKQLLETASTLIYEQRNGKKRKKGSVVAVVALFLICMSSVFVVFVAMADMLCEQLYLSGLSWFYYTIMCTISVILGVFGSVFSTYSSLYRAKDNDLLLSMPIQPKTILIARLFVVWLWGILFEACAYIPTAVIFAIRCEFTPRSVIFELISFFALSLVILTLSCILGGVVALVGSRFRNRSFITVVLSLIFIAAYYYFYSKMFDNLRQLLVLADEISTKLRGSAYPLYVIGSGAAGNPLHATIVVCFSAVAFVLTAAVLSKSFIKLTTTNRGLKKKSFNGTVSVQASISHALLQKEFRHFFNNSNYMLNCGLGILLIPVTAILIIIKKDSLFVLTAMLNEMLPGATELAVAGLICIMASMNDLTAPSISLEGKHIYILQSMPVDPWDVFSAKLCFHLILTEIPVMLFCAAAVFVLRTTLFLSVMLFALPMLFVLFSALTGLAVNLKLPNLTWTNDVVPIKQSASVTIAIFGGFGTIAALAGIYYLLRNAVTAEVYFSVCAVFFAGLSIVVFRWLKKTGTQIFASL